MLNNYDRIARNYDSLSRLIFGKSQVNAQINQLKYIPEKSSILIAGGGTGWILEEISKIHPSGLKITYVELSAKMIKKSKIRDAGNNLVQFFHAGIEDFETDKPFDVVLTPFLFDNFTAYRAESVFRKLNMLLNKNGLWFLVDFSLNNNNGEWWKWMLMKSMYIFFKIIRIVEADTLIDMNPYFLNAGYQVYDEKFYYRNFIRATVYKKKYLLQMAK